MFPETLVIYPSLATLASAEFLAILARSKDLQVLAMRRSQRSTHEQARVNRGLARAVLLELMGFVPVSVALSLLTLRPLMFANFQTWLASTDGIVALHALLGVASYGFPYASLRAAIVKIAVETVERQKLAVPADRVAKAGGPRGNH